MTRATCVCECCDYETPAGEMTTWPIRVTTRVLAAPAAWSSAPFAYGEATLEMPVCIHCRARLERGQAFGDIGHNRLKLGLVVCLILALGSAVAFPVLQPVLTLTFWQAPEENGRRGPPQGVLPAP
jgi:hypothetical protein